jgi:hypothetical protein
MNVEETENAQAADAMRTLLSRRGSPSRISTISLSAADCAPVAGEAIGGA